MRFRLEYGRTGLEIDLPGDRVVRQLAYKDAAPLADPVGDLRRLLERLQKSLDSSVQRSDSCSRAIRSALRSTFRLRIIPRRTRKLLSIVMVVNPITSKGFHRLASYAV